jgi:hypothetical protein
MDPDADLVEIQPGTGMKSRTPCLPTGPHFFGPPDVIDDDQKWMPGLLPDRLEDLQDTVRSVIAIQIHEYPAVLIPVNTLNGLLEREVPFLDVIQTQFVPPFSGQL